MLIKTGCNNIRFFLIFCALNAVYLQHCNKILFEIVVKYINLIDRYGLFATSSFRFSKEIVASDIEKPFRVVSKIDPNCYGHFNIARLL